VLLVLLLIELEVGLVKHRLPALVIKNNLRIAPMRAFLGVLGQLLRA